MALIDAESTAAEKEVQNFSRGGASHCSMRPQNGQPLFELRGYRIGLSLSVSRDDRRITCTETTAEGEITA
ncbi:MAG TPA: hypothetical protein VLU06_02875 [Thermoanaerobaculia bacterium]|nr:hypothetical protein [Thermoanaerobaculia bacterium]